MKGTVTPDLASTYAVESYAVLERLQLRREAFSAAQLRDRFPQFDADGGWLDVDAGFADLAAVTQALRDGLRARGVRVAENTAPRAITRSGVSLGGRHRLGAGRVGRAGGDGGPGHQ